MNKRTLAVSRKIDELFLGTTDEAFRADLVAVKRGLTASFVTHGLLDATERLATRLASLGRNDLVIVIDAVRKMRATAASNV